MQKTYRHALTGQIVYSTDWEHEKSLRKLESEKIKRSENKTGSRTKILMLTAVFAVLIALIPLQTLFWIKNNQPEQPRWFSQTVTYEEQFTFGG